MMPWNDERGATMVEYAIMIGLIAVVALGTVAALGVLVEEALFQPAVDIWQSLSSP